MTRRVGPDRLRWCGSATAAAHHAQSIFITHRPRIPPPRPGCQPRAELEALGALSLGAAVGDGARGLLGIRRLLELFPARAREEPGLPLGRGWAPGDHRPRV